MLSDVPMEIPHHSLADWLFHYLYQTNASNKNWLENVTLPPG